MRAVGIAETALQKRPRPPYFDKPPEQSAGCRLVRTPKISAGIFSHLSALSPFALSGCGHRGGTGGGRILFHPDKHVGRRKIRPAVSNNALLWPGLVLCKRRSFLRAIRICLGAWQTAAAVQSKCLAISCRQASGCRPTYRAGFCLSDLAAFRPVT
ncbi:Uncharacterised protein [Neisseria gonorrhoeae]|nr:Uncharacterised protein [Neisseria gonorrhoeae]